LSEAFAETVVVPETVEAVGEDIDTVGGVVSVEGGLLPECL